MALPYDAAELQRRDPIQSLFDLALGLTPPWRVVGFMFDPDRHPLDIQVGFEPAVRFACPECGATGCPVHDTTAKEWRHLNFFEHEAYLHAKLPRGSSRRPPSRSAVGTRGQRLHLALRGVGPWP